MAPSERFRVSSFASDQATGQTLTLTPGQAFSAQAFVNFRAFSRTGTFFGAPGVLEMRLLDGTDAKNRDVEIRLGGASGIVIHGAEDGYTKAPSDYLHCTFLNAHIGVTYNGSGTADGMSLYLNGDPVDVIATSDNAPGGALQGPVSLWGDMDTYLLEVAPGVQSPAQMKALGATPAVIGSSLYLFEGQARYRKAGFIAGAFGKWMLPSADRIIDAGLWGGEKLGNQTNNYSYGSPTEQFVNELVNQYVPSENRTYIATCANRGGGYARDGYMGYYDHDKKFFALYKRVPSQTRRNAESHQVLSMIHTPPGWQITGQEDLHNSPLYIHRVQGEEEGEAEYIQELGGQNAYVHFGYVGDRLLLACREGEVYNFNRCWRSDDHGLTWSGGERVSDTGNLDLWNYPQTYRIGDTFYLCSRVRNQSNRTHFAIYITTTTDGETFTSLDGQMTKNITLGQYFSPTEFEDHCLLYKTADPALETTVNMFMLKEVGSNLAGILRDEYLNESYYWTYDGSLSLRTIPNPGLSNSIIPLGPDGAYDIYTRKETSQNFWEVWKYQTLDNFASYDAGERISPPGINIVKLTLTRDYEPGMPLLFTCSALIDAPRQVTGLWLYDVDQASQT